MIEIKNVSKKIDDNYILQNINLKFNAGKIYGLVGRNGSGKTMLLNLICGFVKPTSGNIVIEGTDIYKINVFPRNTRALIEHPKFLNNLTGYQNLELLASINDTIGKKEIEKTLKDVGLYSEKDKKYSKYSLGMKQKLGIAQVLMEKPTIMILDEPFNGLDEDSANEIRKIFRYESRKGKIIIIATHIKEDINTLCDVIYQIDGGKIRK